MYTIKLATIEDLDDIIRLNEEAFGDRRELAWSWDVKYIKRSINYNRYIMLVDGIMVGAIHYFKEKHKLYLSSIAIFKEYRGLEYGRELMRFLEKQARKLKKGSIELEARKVNAGFYMKLGYIPDYSSLNTSGYMTYEKRLDMH